MFTDRQMDRQSDTNVDLAEHGAAQYAMHATRLQICKQPVAQLCKKKQQQQQTSQNTYNPTLYLDAISLL